MGARASFSISSMVGGYHKYKDVWVATVGERLLCRREDNNLHDLFSVAVIKNDYVVGHVPKKISTTCSLFLRHRGNIMCIFLYGFLFLHSAASITLATSLFASLMAAGGTIAERSPFGSGNFLTGFKKRYSDICK